MAYFVSRVVGRVAEELRGRNSAGEESNASKWKRWLEANAVECEGSFLAGSC